jgi:hypothetical protein
MRRPRVSTVRDLMGLTVDDARGGTGLSPGLLATFGIKSIVDLPQRSITVPAGEIIVHRALGR